MTKSNLKTSSKTVFKLAAPKLAIVILAAGRGTRMKSKLSKVMHHIAGRPMLAHLIETAQTLSPERIIVVTALDMDDVVACAAPNMTAVQEQALGTGSAVAASLEALNDFDGNVLILLGDMPLISADTLAALIQTKETHENSLSVLGVDLDPTPAFGRLIAQGNILQRIVEDSDCTDAEKAVTLCNTGAFCTNAKDLQKWVPQIGNNNAQSEYYFTDIPTIAANDGAKTYIHKAKDTDEVRGVNSRADLAALEQILQTQLRRKAMDNGATLIDPKSVTFSFDTQTGQDVVIEPNVFFGTGVILGDNVHIKACSHLEGAHVRDDAVIGPFARLRPGTDIGSGSKIGNFVEIKNARLHEGVKAGHLAYIGDAEIGAHTNYSCGAITANYDGFKKQKTIIGENVMVGSNVNLVAPVNIADGAYIAAGSTITKDVEADALAINRGKTRIFDGWAAENRQKNKK